MVMTNTQDNGKPKSVLFVCNQNSIRSPMAHGLADSYCKRRVYVDSAGLIASELNGFSIEVMKELKINIEGYEPKTLKNVQLTDFDLVIALTDMCHDRLAQLLEGTDVSLELWPTNDPCDGEGSRNQMLESYRKVRDQLRARIEQRICFE